MGYMGDRKLPHPPGLAAEILAKGLQIPALRAEIFCQVLFLFFCIA